MYDDQDDLMYDGHGVWPDHHFSEVSRPGPGRQEDNNNDTVTDDDDNEGDACQDETDIVNHNHIQDHFRLTLPIDHLVSGGCGQSVAFNLSMVWSFIVPEWNTGGGDLGLNLPFLISFVLWADGWWWMQAGSFNCEWMTVLLVEHLLTTGSVIIVISQTVPQKALYY